MPLASILMLHFLGEKSIWLDEAFSISVARLDLASMWQMIWDQDKNQSLYYLLLHLWSGLGTTESVVRGLSVILALLTVPLVYLLGTRLFSIHVGLIASLLITVNSSFLHYAQEARGYSLAVLLVTASSYFFVDSIEQPSKSGWAGYVICSTLASYAHLFAVLVLVAHGASLTGLRRRNIPWKGLLISGTAIFLFLLPLAALVLTADSAGMGWIAQPSVVDIGRVFSFLSGGGLLLLLVCFILCANCLPLAARTWINYGRSIETWRYTLLFAWLFVPVIIAFSMSFIKPIFVPRYLIVCLPSLVLLASIGIFHLQRRWLFAVALIILLILSGHKVVYWYTDYEKGDWRGACNYVLSRAKPADAVVFYIAFGRLAFDYYLDRTNTPRKLLIPVNYFSDAHVTINPPYWLPEGYFLGGQQPEPDERLSDRLATAYSRVWLVLTDDRGLPHLRRQSQYIQTLLRKKYKYTTGRGFYGVTVILYERDTP